MLVGQSYLRPFSCMVSYHLDAGKIKKIKFIQIYFFGSIVFCFNRMVLCGWNVDRTWVGNPQRYLQFYRNKLDILDRSAVVWEPYPDEVLQTLPPIYWHGSHIWRARISLICYEIVEMHVPDRVLRQFSLNQHILEPDEQLPTMDRKHRID